VSGAFVLKGNGQDWPVLVRDRVRTRENIHPAESTVSIELPVESTSSVQNDPTQRPAGLSPGIELLLDVELDAALRFGSRELPLAEILDLGPGDVVQLDRQVAEPVDLIVADKIVARGEVVLVNGYFGLRVTEVSAPRKRLESIRCLF
jgi:flagellar motor switch protein FliN